MASATCPSFLNPFWLTKVLLSVYLEFRKCNHLRLSSGIPSGVHNKELGERHLQPDAYGKQDHRGIKEARYTRPGTSNLSTLF